ncbi:MAG TPA: fasciclin domain-containing protein, partial [Bacteroidales bacterium]|nr:fasciclin domain-containing protein [Bacteroidales bacterium]
MRTKKSPIVVLILCFALSAGLESCFFDPGENIYTKKLETIGEFFENDTIFEEFAKVLNETKVMGMLKSYGEYTCFAPTNQAVRNFFANSKFGSLENYPIDSLKNIVLYQLIENDAIQTVDFTSSRLRSNNMVNDQLQVRYDSLGDIVINGMARLLMWDMELRNGVVHLTDAFMLPDTATIDQKFEAAGLNERFSIFNRALKETGIARLMHKTEDQTEYSYYSVKTGAKVIIPRY